ncbi:MAG TPA: histidine kinase [Bacteroidales bacterium]|nr:histidine kinase [Bacteroidales bacterium]
MPLRTIAGILILINLACFGQLDNYYLKSYSVSDGLPNNHVRWITQDRDGFLWLATWDGLARFDGVRFKIYRHDPNDSTSVSFFEIIKVAVDSGNRVWVFAGGRLCRYDRSRDNFIRYNLSHFPTLGPGDGPGEFFDILIDPEGSLLVACGFGFYRYDPESDRFASIHPAGNKAGNFIPSFPGFDNMNNLWLMWVDKTHSDYAEVYKCSYKHGQVLSVVDSFVCDPVNFRSRFTNETIRFNYYLSSAGEAWMASSLGLYYLQNDTFKLSQNKIPKGHFSNTGMILWSGHNNGLMIDYLPENHVDTLFEDGRIETVIAYHHDELGNVWFSDMSEPSVKNGLSHCFRTGNYFRHYLTGLEGDEPYVIYGLYKDRVGNIWAGGRPNTHIVKISPDGVEQQINLPFHPVKYFNVPRNIEPDLNGHLWIAFFSDYLFSLDPGTLQYTDFSGINMTNPTNLSKINYRLVKPYGRDLLFSAGAGKLYKVNTLTGNVITSSAPNGWDIFCLYPVGDNTLWVGLSGRLLLTDFGFNKQEIIPVIDPFYNIEDICPGDSSYLWLALLGGGICRFDTLNHQTSFFTTFNGLAHNTVYSIRKDQAGNLWISHNLGISMFNPVTKSFTNYDEKDGLKIKEFNSEAACQTDQGEILFGGIGGIVSFFPDSIRNQPDDDHSKLMISDFRIANKVYPFDKPVSEMKKVRLPKGTDNFQLEFIKPDFRNGDEIRYRYTLGGRMDKWTETDCDHRRVNFTSLRPGDYEFIVECTDSNGEWANSTMLLITIPPYFYQTIVFRLLLAIVVMVVLGLFFYMKLKQIRLSEHKKQEQLRLETLRGQMNPHFIYNSLNSINYFISLNDRLNANQYITDFSRLMRSIMTNSAQDYITLESEIQAIKDYLALEHLRFSNKFDYEIKTDEALDLVITEVAPSLVQPFIENAIWHGLRYIENRKGFLSVRFIMEGNGNLVCYVDDDGIGRKLSVKLKTGDQKKRNSRGIAIVTERLAIINSMQKSRYSVRVMNMYGDREETGTKVRIEIPFRRSL